PHLLGALGPDAARDVEPARRGRGDRQRAGRAARDEPAVGVAAPQGARARRARQQEPVGAVAALPARDRPPRPGGRVAGAVPGVLRGAHPRPRAATRKRTETGGAMTDEPQRHLNLRWTLDAPRADVFRAWTDPEHLQWFYNPAQPVPDDPIVLDL